MQASQQKADPNALYAVWGGGNDYLFGNPSNADQTVNNLSDSIGALATAGAKNILVFNLPDLGKTPFAAKVNPNLLSDLTVEHNQKLAAALGNFSSIPGVNIIPVDTNSLFAQVLNNPEKFGFKNATGSCVIGDFSSIQSVCNNPNDFVFFDAVHPTTGAYKLVADAALTAVRSKTIPEPSAVLGMLALGVMGATGVMKRKLTSADRFVGAEPSRIK